MTSRHKEYVDITPEPGPPPAPRTRVEKLTVKLEVDCIVNKLMADALDEWAQMLEERALSCRAHAVALRAKA